MLVLIKKLFSSSTNEEALEIAVSADDVKKAYAILSARDVNVNAKLSYRESVYDSVGDDYVYQTRYSSLLEEAKSEPMKRLLRHFGALPLETLKKRWKAEEKEASRKRNEEIEKEIEEKRKQLAQKAEADDLFLNSVLC